ncbi:hypothetical protein Fmac_006742 [Flemingia macrophylla]|uniref:Uncharacterized protein n=1 Tax=Flemingia macrophylla TaxID=520843 RepID=A0ABD1NBG9_9FABA
MFSTISITEVVHIFKGHEDEPNFIAIGSLYTLVFILFEVGCVVNVRAMGGISGGLKKYWRRRVTGYQRLIHGSDRRRRETVKLGGSKRRRKWQIKVAPKMRIPKISSPKKMVLWVRDAYVRMMLGLASSIGGSAVGYGGDPPAKEYEEKMVVHMYKSLLMAHGHLLPRHPPPNAAATIVNTSS